MTETIQYIAKAIIAAIVTFLGGLATAISGEGISAQEWITVAIATVIALGAVFQFPNGPKPGTVVPTSETPQVPKEIPPL